MSAEPHTPLITDEPFVWDGPGIVTYDEETGGMLIDVTPDEYRAMWEQQVRDMLGISAQEFERKVDAGEYGEDLDDPDHWQLMYLAIRRP